MLNKYLYQLLALSFLILSCNRNPQTAEQPVKVKDRLQAGKTKHSRLLKIDTMVLKTLSAEQAQLKFGKARQFIDFDLSEPLTEFRIEIYNYIQKDKRNSAEVKIRELTWTYNQTDNLTAWYIIKGNKRIFLHYHIWPNNAVF